MRSFFVVALLITALSTEAATPAAGRWRGVIHVPGQDIGIVVDFAAAAGAQWHGSLIAPSLNLKGAPLSKITVTPTRVAFSLEGALGPSPDGLASFDGALRGGASLEGTFSQGGHQAPFTLTRVGDAEVDQPRSSTAVESAVAGTWRGDYELGGYPRHVTLTFQNHAGDPASVEFLVVGKLPHTLAVDLVSEEEGLVRVESHAYRINFEGRLSSGSDELRGVIEQGPEDAPIVLRRASGGAP